jgi:hypothetical protein
MVETISTRTTLFMATLAAKYILSGTLLVNELDIAHEKDATSKDNVDSHHTPKPIFIWSIGLSAMSAWTTRTLWTYTSCTATNSHLPCQTHRTTFTPFTSWALYTWFSYFAIMEYPSIYL